MKKDLTIGIFFLFLFSALSPIVISLNVNVKNEMEPQLNMQSKGPMNSAWPTYSHDNCHTGQSHRPRHRPVC